MNFSVWSELISIIVPVYNIEKYIGKCISSLVNQSYRNIEILLINDGSTDGSATICEEYCRYDSRVKLINRCNGGLSVARNTGLENASGEIITFVDGDDYLQNDCLENAISAMKDADMCIFQYIRVDEAGEELQSSLRRNPHSFEINGIDGMIKLLTDDSIGGVVACGKLYRKSLFDRNSILFPEGKYHEDCFTTYKLCFYSKKIIYIPTVGYMYVQRNHSIVHSNFKDSHLDKILAADECILFTKEHSPGSVYAAECAAVRWYMQTANRIFRSGVEQGRKKELIIIKNKIMSVHYLSNKSLSIKYRILALVYTKSFVIYKFLLNVFKREDK